MMIPLLSADQFAAATGGQVAASDARLGPLLDAASAAVRRYCGWHIGPVAEETLVLDGPGGDLLVLPTLRLEAVTAFWTEGTPDGMFQAFHRALIVAVNRAQVAKAQRGKKSLVHKYAFQGLFGFMDNTV